MFEVFTLTKMTEIESEVPPKEELFDDTMAEEDVKKEEKPKRDKFSSYESIRNQHIFYMIFIGSFFYWLTDKCIGFWPELQVIPPKSVPMTSYKFTSHYLDYDQKPGSQAITYDSKSGFALGVTHFQNSPYPDYKSTQSLITLAYLKSGYKPIGLKDANGKPFRYYDNDDLMNEVEESELPDFIPSMVPKDANSAQIIDSLAAAAVRDLPSCLSAQDRLSQLYSENKQSQAAVDKYFTLNVPTAPEYLPATGGKSFESVKDLLYIGIILSQRQLYVKLEENSLYWNTVKNHFTLRCKTDFELAGYYIEAVKKNSDWIRQRTTEFVLNMELLMKPDPSLSGLAGMLGGMLSGALAASGLSTGLLSSNPIIDDLSKDAKKVSSTPKNTFLPNCTIDPPMLAFLTDTRNLSYIEGLLAAGETDFNKIFGNIYDSMIKLYARKIVVNVPLNLSIKQSSSGATVLEGDRDEMYKSIRDRLGRTYSQINSSFKGVPDYFIEVIKGQVAVGPAVYPNIHRSQVAILTTLNVLKPPSDCVAEMINLIHKGIPLLPLSDKKHARTVKYALTMVDCSEEMKNFSSS